MLCAGKLTHQLVRHAQRHACARVGHDVRLNSEYLTKYILRDYLLRRPFAHHSAALNRNHVLSIAGRMIQIVHHHNDSTPFFRVQLLQQLQHLD